MTSPSTLRRITLAALSGMVLTPLVAFSQPKPLRIFMILYRGETEVEKGFRAYFIEHNIPVELIVRDVAQDVAKTAGFIAEARRMQVDLVYTWGTPVTLAAVGKKDAVDPAKHLTAIPVVFNMVSSPRAAGLVAQGNSSGRNITGASHVVPIDQQLTAIRNYRPLSKMAVMFNPGESNSVLVVKDLREASKRDGFILKEFPIPLDENNKPVEAALPNLIRQISQTKPQFLYLGPDSFIGAQRKVITETALAQKLPLFSATEILLRDGRALFGLVSAYEQLGRLAAYKVEQILIAKKRPQDIPIETLSRFSYIVNMAVASELDFYPPLNVVNFAEMIE